jgi:hypothetical protein
MANAKKRNQSFKKLLGEIRAVLQPRSRLGFVLTKEREREQHEAAQRHAVYMENLVIPKAEQAWDKLVEVADNKGWTVTREKPDGPIEAEGMADTQAKTIQIAPKFNISVAVYLLAHELGHAFGEFAYKEPTKLDRVAMGLYGPSVAPLYLQRECEAETVATLIVASLGGPVDVGYFVNWSIPPNAMEAVERSATKVATDILAAL